MNRFVFACALGGAIIAIGCSAAKKDTSSDDEGDDSESAQTDSANLDPNPKGGGSASGSRKNTCGAQQTADSCYACCSDQNKAGVAILNLDVNACLCDDPGPCARVCGDTFCAGAKQVTQECGQCLQTNGNACLQIAETRCGKDKDCAALEVCVQASACDSKPPAQKQ